MRTFDLSPLFRSTIGFDRMSRLIDSALAQDPAAAAYPPYNIEKTGEDAYRITMAVAGFTLDDLDVMVRDDVLTIEGRAREDDEAQEYLHRGIAARAFTRRFSLAEHVRVEDAALRNGLLSIDLVREIPEAKRPRSIPIANGDKSARMIDQNTAEDHEDARDKKDAA